MNDAAPSAFIYDPAHHGGAACRVTDRADQPMEAVFIPRGSATCTLDGVVVEPGRRYPVGHGSQIRSDGPVGVELSPAAAAAKPTGNG